MLLKVSTLVPRKFFLKKYLRRQFCLAKSGLFRNITPTPVSTFEPRRVPEADKEVQEQDSTNVAASRAALCAGDGEKNRSN